jgi:TolB-like protein
MKRCPQCNRVETDETLKFCRVDGATLVSDSSSLGADSGTMKLGSASVADEIETSILPHATDANINRPTAPTTAFVAAPSVNTGPLAKTSRRKTVVAIVAVAIAVVAVGTVLLVRSYLATKSSAAIESIAVLPFENRGNSADADYLCDGLAESLIYRLSQLPNLKVSPTSSVMRYKGKGGELDTIANELGVRAVLIGKLVQRGDNLIISVELIDVANKKLLWGEQYDRKLAELLVMQREIATTITNKLQLKLSGEGEQKLAKKHTDNNEAYQLYLKGRFYWNKRTGESLKQAAELYRQAIEKDLNYALAYSGLAETYVLYSSYDVAPAGDSMPQAKAAALRALAIDDSLAEAHTALAFYLSNYEWDRESSEKEYRRAIELKPNYSTAHHWLGADLGNLKRFDESIVEMRRAEELDPLSAIIGTNLGDMLVLARRYDEAIAQYKRTLVRNPNFAYAYVALSRAYGAKGMYAEAIAETRRYMDLDNNSVGQGILGLWLAKSGKRDEAMKLLAELKQESTRKYVQNYDFALIYIGLGNKADALNYLEKHMTSRAETANTYAVAPELDELRSEPRFKAMLKRMNLPE